MTRTKDTLTGPLFANEMQNIQESGIGVASEQLTKFPWMNFMFPGYNFIHESLLLDGWMMWHLCHFLSKYTSIRSFSLCPVKLKSTREMSSSVGLSQLTPKWMGPEEQSN